jgi:putative solute:sodium symporter small subunit
MTGRADTPGGRDRIRWHRTTRLAAIVLALWGIFGFAVHGLVVPLNTLVIAGFPLGYYMAAQGSLVVFVILVFWFSARQDRIDREAGVAEPDPAREELPL